MKRLLVDHLRRKAWFLAAAALFTAFLGWATAAAPEAAYRSLYGVVAQAGVLSGAAMLFWDLQRGAGRAVALLPLRRHEIARAWWLAAVAVPALVLSLSLVLGACAHALFSTKGGLQPEPLFAAILSLWLFTGAAFWLLLAVPLGPARDWRQRGATAGWVFVLSAGTLMSKAPLNPAVLSVLLVLGVGATVLGWFFAPRLVGKSRRTDDADGAKTADRVTESDHPGRRGGVPYLVAQVVLRSIAVTALFLAGFSLFQFVGGQGGSSTLPLSRLIPVVAAPALPLTFFSGFQFLLPQLRSLRALPLSTSGLATLMLGLTLLPVMIFASLVFATLACLGDGAFHQVFALMLLVYLSGGALALLALVLLGGGKRSIAFVTVLFLGSQFAMFPLTITMHDTRAPLPLGLATVATALLVAAVWRALPAALARSSRAYRPKAFGEMRPVWERP